MTRLESRMVTALAAAVVLLAGILACDSDSLAPFEPEVTNATDNFQLQATDVRQVSATLEYTWQNTGTSANVNQATVISAGTATLTIEDATGVEVYSRSLADNGTFTTTAGASGAWKIRASFSGYSGTLNFRVQKP